MLLDITLNSYQFCKAYAEKAVAQYDQAKQYHLPGIVPPVWSGERSGHFNWCLKTPENIVNNGSAQRQRYIEKYLTKKVPGTGVVSGVAGTLAGGGGAVAATPISIPRPVYLEKMTGLNLAAEQKDIADLQMQAAGHPGAGIERCDLIAINGNVMRIGFQYRIGSPPAGTVYAGAFLYDANQKVIDAGYRPAAVQRLPRGRTEVLLTLPAEPFHSAFISAFLIHSGRILVNGRFKLPLHWDGKGGHLDAPMQEMNRQGAMETAPGKPAVFPASNNHDIFEVNPIGLDPGQGGKTLNVQH